MDKNLQNELFGSDSDDSDDTPAPPPSAPTGGELVPADGEEGAGDDVGEAELFGSDDDEADEAPRRILPPSAPSAPPLHYELPLLPRPEAGCELYTMRLPNILSIEPRPFHPLTFGEDDADEESGKTDNIIRWRETEEGVRQSNARVVTWSDGSMTLHVGDEVLTAAPHKVEGGNQLFTRHKGSNLECHGLVRKKLVLQPASIKSSTHKALTKRIAKNHIKKTGMQSYTTTQDPEKKKLEDEKIWEQKNRLQARQESRRTQDYGEGGEELTTGFLDSDDDVGEGNLGAIKRRFGGKDKKGKRKAGGSQPAAAPRAAFGGKRPRSLGRRDEGSDSSEERDESEEDGDPEEMEGFIVDDEKAEPSDSEEEAEDSDDSEAKAPKKRGRK